MSPHEMLAAHPNGPSGADAEKLAACIQACIDCAQTCTACADACLSEQGVGDLTQCIRADLDCADMCEATGRLLSRHSGQDVNLARAFLDTCIAACKACADECARHAPEHEHCKLCAEACARCERACLELLDSLALA